MLFTDSMYVLARDVEKRIRRNKRHLCDNVVSTWDAQELMKTAQLMFPISTHAIEGSICMNSWTGLKYYYLRKSVLFLVSTIQGFTIREKCRRKHFKTCLSQDMLLSIMLNFTSFPILYNNLSTSNTF